MWEYCKAILALCGWIYINFHVFVKQPNLSNSRYLSECPFNYFRWQRYDITCIALFLWLSNCTSIVQMYIKPWTSSIVGIVWCDNRKLPCAPDHIVQCEQMTSFFRGLASSPSASNVSVFTLSHPLLSTAVSPTASTVTFHNSSMFNQPMPAAELLNDRPTEFSTFISRSCAQNVLPTAAVPLPAFSADAKNLHIATSHSETALLHANNVRKIGLY